jgi:hypothetical protein
MPGSAALGSPCAVLPDNKIPVAIATVLRTRFVAVLLLALFIALLLWSTCSACSIQPDSEEKEDVIVLRRMQNQS